jgi:hypothetical protein
MMDGIFLDHLSSEKEWPMNEIFSEKVVTNRRTYFFDVKETKEGSKYLVIGELTQIGSETERHRVMVFEESLDSFVYGLDKAIDFIRYGQVRERDLDEEGDDSLKEILERIEQSINEIRGHFR